MSGMLTGKIALVTGGGRGIGRAIALRLAREGAVIALHYGAGAEKAQETVAEIKALGVDSFALGADLRSVKAIAGLFDALDAELKTRTGEAKFDILVNNAGAGAGGMLVRTTTEQQFNDAFDLNVRGLFFVTQYAMPRLRDNGRIVNLSSIAARGVTAAGIAYKATKAAVNALTPSLAVELGSRGITVNAIAPGATATDMLEPIRENEQAIESIKAVTAFRRIGQPEDIADAVALLMSEDARWITGQIIEASGGARL